MTQKRLFISYAREDKPGVRALAKGLQDAGYETWWDDELVGGDSFRELIASRLETADAVIVVWSARSTNSRWVLDEAERAAQRGVLLPIRIDDVRAPLGFAGTHVVDFSAWDGNFNSELWRDLLTSIQKVVTGQRSLPTRPAIPIAKNVSIATAVLGTPAGGLLWIGYRGEVVDSVFGHPAVDMLALSCTLSFLVVLRNGIDARDAGFGGIRVVFRRSVAAISAAVLPALAILAIGATAGPLRLSSAAGPISELLRVFIPTTLLCAAGISGFKLLRRTVRNALSS